GMEDRSPVRVVLDGALRLPIESKLIVTARQAPLWVVTGEDAPADREQALLQTGAEVMRSTATAGKLEIGRLLRRLAERGITRLMVESGPILAAALVKADLVDEAVIFRSPKTIGREGIDALEGMPLEALANSLSRIS